MFWLPAKLPAGVKVIISTKSSDLENIKELVKERHFKQIEITELTHEYQKDLCQVCFIHLLIYFCVLMSVCLIVQQLINTLNHFGTLSFQKGAPIHIYFCLIFFYFGIFDNKKKGLYQVIESSFG